MLKADMFAGNDIREVTKNLLGCVLHFPQASYVVKKGIITGAQWYDVESKDPETTEDRQGDALLIAPGLVFIFETMAQTVILISALSDQTRACVRINEVAGVADRAQLVSRAIGISSINREKYQRQSILDHKSLLYITAPEIQVPEPEFYIPKGSKQTKAMRITL